MWVGQARGGDLEQKALSRGSCTRIMPFVFPEIISVNQTNKPNRISLRRLNLAAERRQSMSAVARVLQKRYGDFDHHNRRNPLEELLFILCSVQCADAGV